MPLSKKEERAVYDNIYFDLLDLKAKILEIVDSENPCRNRLVQELNNARNNIPGRAVRLAKKDHSRL